MKKLLQNIGVCLLGFLFFNLIAYLVGSLLAWTLNPANWKLFSSEIKGQWFVFALVETYFVYKAIKINFQPAKPPIDQQTFNKKADGYMGCFVIVVIIGLILMIVK